MGTRRPKIMKPSALVAAALVAASFTLTKVQAWNLPAGLGGDQLQKALQTRLEESLKRKCQLGPVRFEGSQIVTDKLVISNDPDFTQGTFLTAEQVALTMDLQSLLTALDSTALTPNASKGRLTAAKVTHANYRAGNVALDWNLDQLRQGLTLATGTVVLSHGPAAMNLRSAVPAEASQALAQLGLPNLSSIPISGLRADGRVGEGLLRLNQIVAQSPEGTLKAKGMLKLESDALAVTALVNRPPAAGRGETNAEIEVTGTSRSPSVRLKSLKQKNFRAKIAR
jgi:hypothetical protein